jgi:hypothetical protein
VRLGLMLGLAEIELLARVLALVSPCHRTAERRGGLFAPMGPGREGLINTARSETTEVDDRHHD